MKTKSKSYRKKSFEHKIYSRDKRRESVIEVDKKCNNKKLDNKNKSVVEDGKKTIQKKDKRIEFHALLKDFRKHYIDSISKDKTPQKIAEKKFVELRAKTQEFVCVCCNRLKFERSMMKTPYNKEKLYKQYSRKGDLSMEDFDRSLFSDFPSDRLCSQCNNCIVAGKIPRYAVCNGFAFPDVPEEVKMLNFTEQMLVIPYLPFIQIAPLVRFLPKAQLGAKGCVIHVPVEILFHKCIPFNIESVVHGIIKRSLEHKTIYCESPIRPKLMLEAMQKLVDTPLYRREEIKVDFELFHSMMSQLFEQINFSEDVRKEFMEFEYSMASISKSYTGIMEIKGIVNENNYCYMNSILQMLANIFDSIPGARNSYEDTLYTYLQDINNVNQTAYHNKIVQLSRDFRLQVPYDFIYEEQQDPHEYLIRQIFENCESIQNLFQIKFIPGDGITMGCSENFTSNCISLPINSDNNFGKCDNNLQNILNQQLDNIPNCGHCNKKHNLIIHNLDADHNNCFLILQLNVFTYDNQFKLIRKIFYRGEIDKEIKINSNVYELNSVVSHIGQSASHGHYICYRKHRTNWYKCNDEQITLVQCPNNDKDNMDLESPYLLLYKLKTKNNKIILKQGKEERIPAVNKADNDEDEFLYDLFDRDGNCGEAVLINRNFPVQDPGNVYVIAPGQGKKPIHFSKIPNILEFICVDVFGGQPANIKEGITFADRIKAYSTNVSKSMRTPFKLLYMAVLYLEMQLNSAINTSIRQGNNRDTKLKAKDVLNNKFVDELVCRNEAFMVTKQVRTSPAYFHKAKVELLAMVRQLGMPTFFLTFSAGEPYWPELLVTLMKLQKNKQISVEEAYDLTSEEKAELIQAEPGICAKYFNEKIYNLFEWLKNPFGPFGEYRLDDYFVRHEFQMRGSPHIHCLFWLKNAPKLKDGNENKDLIAFIDKFTSCRNDETNPFIRFHKHKHTKTCGKGQKNPKNCRFHFPRPPMNSTKILQPIPKTEITIKIKEDLKKINSLMNAYYRTNSNDTYEEMLLKLQMSEDDYITAIRSSISAKTLFLQRRPLDVAINNYCPQLINAWEANTDIQFVLEENALITYILNYVVKDEIGMVQSIRDAIKEARQLNKSVRDVYKVAASAFLSSNLMSAQEAFYHCAQLKMIEKSRSCIFLNTNRSDQRTRILKSNTDIQQLPSDSEDVFQNGIIEKYSSRPEHLENMYLAYYASTYHKINHPDYVYNEMEYNENNLERLKIIRHPTFSLRTGEAAYYRQLIMLYLPWRNEETDLNQVNAKDVYENNIDIIEMRSKFFNTLKAEKIEEAMQQYIENKTCISISDDVSHFGSRASEGLVNPFEDEDDDMEDDKILNHVKTKKTKNKVEFVIILPPRIDKNSLYSLLHKLNEEQRKIVMHLFHCFKICRNNEIILMIGPAGTGKSLTIQSIYQLITNYFDLHGKTDTAKVLLTAPTGKAAFAIKGQTLHAAFKIKPEVTYTTMPGLSDDAANTMRIAYTDLKLIIIDEVSMVGSRMLNHVNIRLQQIFQNNLLFGGRSVLMVGDFNQLKPVRDKTVFESEVDNNYLELSKLPFEQQLEEFVMSPIMEEAQLFELSKIERQKDDKEMIEALNEMSVGHMSEKSIKYFERRVCKLNKDIPSDAIRLMRTNDEVNQYNQMRISEFPGKQTIIEASHEFSFRSTLEKEQKSMYTLELKSFYSNDKAALFNNLRFTLTLKIGIKYMVIANIDVADGLYNGATGTLYKIEHGSDKKPIVLWLEFDSIEVGRKARMERLKYIKEHDIPDTVVPIEKYSCTVNGKKFVVHEVTRVQFPVVPAEAITIHKCQGQTYKKACVYLTAKPKLDRAMQYVACSRVQDINGLYIKCDTFYPTKPIEEDKVQIVPVALHKMRSNQQLQLSYEDFRNKMGIVIGYQNIRSYQLHYDKILCDLWYQNCDILVFSETNIKQNTEIESIPGYDIAAITYCPESSNCRGIIVFKRPHVNVSVHHEVANIGKSNIDLLYINLNDGINIITGYRSPNAPFSQFKNLFEKILMHIVSTQMATIIIGDFNYDCKKENQFSKLMNEIGFSSKLSVDYSTTDMDSQIDIIFSNYNYLYTGTYDSYFSDHKPIFCEVFDGADMTKQRLAKLEKKQETTACLVQKLIKMNRNIERTCDDTDGISTNQLDIKNIIKKNTKQRSTSKSVNKKAQDKNINITTRKRRKVVADMSTNFLKNTINCLYNGVTYCAYNNCCFDSLTFGFRHLMKHFEYTEYIFREYSSNKYFRFVNSLTNCPENNGVKVIEYYLSVRILKRPVKGNTLNKAMDSSIDDMIKVVLNDYVSYFTSCDTCNLILHGETVFEYIITTNELINLEQFIMEKFQGQHRQCNNELSVTVHPGFMVRPNCGDGCLAYKVKLQSIPATIAFGEREYMLSFIISYEEMPPANHFITFCYDKFQWLKYDDLHDNIVNADPKTIVNPCLIMYVDSEYINTA